jgi:hypothetical protein
MLSFAENLNYEKIFAGFYDLFCDDFVCPEQRSN